MDQKPPTAVIESASTFSSSHVSTWAWNPAVPYDVGAPDVIPSGAVDFEGNTNTREHYLFASGADPVNPSLTYRVLARRYTNALVLVKLSQYLDPTITLEDLPRG
jgi:hypothetical protein